ncbi:MAG: GGDEF domain-containing protein [Spirochaetia bacterium]
MNELFLRIDINLYAIFLLIIILISLYMRKNEKILSTRYFILLTYSVILLLVLECLSWTADGKQGSVNYHLNYLTHFVFLLLNPLPPVLWLCYLDLNVHNSLKRLRKRGYYMLPLLLAGILMVVSLFTGFVFTINEANFYTRGDGIAVLAAINFCFFGAGFIIVYRKRKSLERRAMLSLFSFSIIPVMAAVLQLMFYGILIIWSSITLCVLISFIFLEIQHLGKDDLTGLYNRKQIDSRLQARIGNRSRRADFSLILIDLDDFKKINDTYGHIEGDKALIIFSNILMQTFKRDDLISRYGGDEFLIVLRSAREENIKAILNRLENRVDDFNARNVKPYRLEFSAGFQVYNPEVHADLTDLIQDVDRKMYDMKAKKTLL